MAGCGKNTILRDIVRPLLGDMALDADGAQSTEAGLRQELQLEARPIVIVDPVAKRRIQAIIQMMRSAYSTSGKTYKGTPSGKGVSFELRSMICLAAVGGTLADARDRQSIAILPLRDPSCLGRKKGVIHRIPPILARRLLARTTKWARSGKLAELLTVTNAAATIVLGNQRQGDKYGTLLAGTFTLMRDDVPRKDQVIAYIKDLELEDLLFGGRGVKTSSTGCSRPKST